MSQKILYNVTVKIAEEIAEDWIKWMTSIHIPDVMKTQMFLSYKMSEIFEDEKDGGRTFAIQYKCENLETFNSYQSIHAKNLQKEHAERYANKYVAFRTLMKIISES